METIEFKYKPASAAIRIFAIWFVLSWLAKHCAYGFSIFSDPDILLILRARAIEALTAAVVFFLASLIDYGKTLNIVLTEKTLQAPMKKRRFELLKSTTVELSDISINRSLRDRLMGTQVITSDGQPVHIHSLFYAPKSISKLLDEIERRQENIKESQPAV